MAAPKDLTTLNVSAVYAMVRCLFLCYPGTPNLTWPVFQNKTLSDHVDGILSTQGVRLDDI
jgi:hypothetical protein